jgi:hypothetical protein
MNQAVITFTNSTARASAITSPVEGMVTYLADTDTYQFWNGSAWTALVSASSGNAIINGGFDIWQRGTSVTVTGAYAYGAADRFKVFTDTGVSSVNSQQTFTPGTAPVAGYEAQYFLRSTKSANSGGWIVEQPIEDVRSFAGQTATLSFYAKAGSATTITPKFLQLFGSGGSGAVTTTASSLSLTTSWARYSVTVSIPSISGKTVGAGSSLNVRLWDIADANAYTFDIWGVQLESGSTATAFRRNANSLEGELAACQRYYQRFSGGLSAVYGNGSAYSSTAVSCIVNFNTTMRISPTSVEWSSLRFEDTGGGNYNASTIGLDGDRTNTARAFLYNTVSSGLTQFRLYSLVNASNAAGFLAFSSEL